VSWRKIAKNVVIEPLQPFTIMKLLRWNMIDLIPFMEGDKDWKKFKYVSRSGNLQFLAFQKIWREKNLGNYW
jgi:hypothetical protein